MFENRFSAGQELAKKLIAFKNRIDVLVLAIPRGGVVVGRKVTDSLNLPLNVILVKKLGAPYERELAIGAVAEEKTVVWNKDIVNSLNVGKEYKKEVLKNKVKEIEEQKKKFRKGKELNFLGKTVILVDDGIATGETMEAAVRWIKDKGQKIKERTMDKREKMVLAVPVCSREAYGRLKPMVDEFLVLEIPEEFYAVGQFYEEFPQVEDEEVVKLLKI